MQSIESEIQVGELRQRVKRNQIVSKFVVAKIQVFQRLES